MSQEAQRLAVLSAYEAVGAGRGRDLDRIVRLLAELLEVPVALVSLLREEGPAFVARFGLDEPALDRHRGFFHRAMREDGLFLLPDAPQDPRFAEAFPAAAGNEPRFYAGVPLMTSPDGPLRGHRLGTLCVLDHAPRPAPDSRLGAVLSSFAQLVADRMELRRVEFQRRRVAERLHRDAQRDPLTGLPNRARLLELLRQAAARSGATRGSATRGSATGGSTTGRGATKGGAAALILLDIDEFRQINETLGREAGDALLQAAAQRLAACLAHGDTLARVGGDDFAVLLHDATPDAAEAMAQRLQRCLLDAPFRLHGQLLRVGATAGLAAAPDRGTLLADAELAMREAKRLGDGHCLRYEPRLRAAEAARLRLEDELRRATARGEFVLFYQPQVRLADRALLGVEALLRWQHPERGLLLPGAFLDTLESGSCAAEVGDWVIDEACRQAAAWRAAGLPLRVAINLFGEQLRRGGLADTVRAALARHALPPDALEVELTERIVLHRPDPELAPLRELGAMGIELSLDDFGTGFASLATLKQMPVTRLKIDRGFVADLDSDAFDAAIVAAVLALGRSLGLGVIAEGIETEAQEQRLIELGCEEAQGFRYGRPVPAAEIGAPQRRNRSRPRGGS